jgi:hypothetical protein
MRTRKETMADYIVAPYKGAVLWISLPWYIIYKIQKCMCWDGKRRIVYVNAIRDKYANSAYTRMNKAPVAGFVTSNFKFFIPKYIKKDDIKVTVVKEPIYKGYSYYCDINIFVCEELVFSSRAYGSSSFYKNIIFDALKSFEMSKHEYNLEVQEAVHVTSGKN